MERKKQTGTITMPEGKENESEAWEVAYRHAFGRGCSEKASILYADAHAEDFSDVGHDEDSEMLRARISALEAQLEDEKAKTKEDSAPEA